MDAVARHIHDRVVEALADTRVVVIQGARQVGKTTLVQAVTEQRDGRLVTLDDPTVLAAAQADPPGFLAQHPGGTLAIDEVQRAPELVLALKLAVDTDRRPGRFLLTGSANLLRLPATGDSLAGRAESIELFGFSQGELHTHREQFIDRLLSGDTFAAHVSSLNRADYLDRACTGGYPEVITRTTDRRRAAWIDNYLQRIVERDAPDVSGLHHLEELPRLLRLIAARNAGELNISALASDAGIPTRTLAPYLNLLETLYLIQRVPAWSTNLSKRVVSRPKSMLLDSGLAARLNNVSASHASTAINPDLAGALLEGFVAGELRRQLGWCQANARISHYRDHDGAEVDLILEADDGRIAGIEVKSTSSVTARDARWLSRLRDKLGNRFAAGVILHTGPTSSPFGDRIAAVPMDALWTT